jgi:hypothetical protein
LPLDLILWWGIPAGILVVAIIGHWVWQRLRSVRTAEDAIFCMFILAIGNHAMLEMPLYYGYFLFPAGLVIGALNTRSGSRPVMQLGRWVGVLFWTVAAALLALIIRDYAKVEPSYQTLQREWDNIQVTGSATPPDVLLLTQWSDYIQYARLQPASGMSADQIERLTTVVVLHPNLLLLHNLAMTLALNKRPEEAGQWLVRMCRTTDDTLCPVMKKYWDWQARENPAMRAIPWPDISKNH